jgi:flagellar assembly protein FliH
MDTLETNHGMQRFKFTSFDAKEEKVAVTTAETKTAKKEEAPLPAGPLPLPLTLPAITEKDLQTARSDAQAQGYREGYAAAQSKFDKEAATREDAIKALLEIISNRITLAAEAHGEAMKGRTELMGKLVIAAARKVAGEALKKEPYAPIESLLHECMGLIAGEAKVNIVVSTTLVAGLKQRIDTITPTLQGFTGDLKVEEDVALMDHDCRVEWKNGYSERSTEDLWSALEAIVMKTNINA